MATTLSTDRKIWINIKNKINELENKPDRDDKDNIKLKRLLNMWRDRYDSMNITLDGIPIRMYG